MRMIGKVGIEVLKFVRPFCYTYDRRMDTDFRSCITKTYDWPRLGIVTYDVAPLLLDPVLFRELIERMATPYVDTKIDTIVGIEARGFSIGAALAYRLGTGFAMIRKNGKLPPPTVSQEYSYEYASQVIEIGSTTLKEGARVVLVDDILATGGTMAASVKLLRRFSVHIVGISCIIEMTSMAGRDRLKQQTIHSVLTYH